MFKSFLFCLFNALLPGADILTDFLSGLGNFDDSHVFWGAVTVALMFNPILLHSATLIFDLCKACRKGTPINIKSELKKLVIHIPFFLPLRNFYQAFRLWRMDFGTANFNSKNSLKVEKIQNEAASDGLAESFTESGPQSVHQSRIMLCTGIFGWTQGISIPISILSLAWGASRAFFLHRSEDQSDADPNIKLVATQVFPWMILSTLVSVGFWTMIGGLFGIFTFPALLMSFSATYLVLTLVDKSMHGTSKARADVEKMDNTPKKNLNFVASLTSLWIPCIPGSKPHTFLTSAVCSTALKVFWLVVAVDLNVTKTIRPNTYMGFCQEDAEFFEVERNLTLCQVGGGDYDYDYDSCFNSSSPNLQKIRVCTSKGEQAHLVALTFSIAAFLAFLSTIITWQLHKKIDYETLYDQTKSGCFNTKPHLHQSVVYKLCTSDENVERLSEVVVDQEVVINRPRRGQTALHLATQAGAARCTAVLLEAGARPVVDSNDKWPNVLNVAVEKNVPEIITFLLQLKGQGGVADKFCEALLLEEDSAGLKPIQVAESKWPHLVRPLKMLQIKTGHHQRGVDSFILTAPALVAWAQAEGEEKEEKEALLMEAFLYGAVMETGTMDEQQRLAVVRAEEEWRALHPGWKSLTMESFEAGDRWSDLSLTAHGQVTGLQVKSDAISVAAVRARYGGHWGDWRECGSSDGREVERSLELPPGRHVTAVNGASHDRYGNTHCLEVVSEERTELYGDTVGTMDRKSPRLPGIRLHHLAGRQTDNDWRLECFWAFN